MVSHGRAGWPDGVTTHRSSWVWSACQICVGLGGLAAVHQVEHLLVPLGALVRERGHRRVDARAPRRTPWRSPAPAIPAPGPPRPPGGARWRCGRRAAQRQALDQQLQIGRHPPGSPVRARPARPARPALRRGSRPASGAASARDAVLAGHADQRAAVLEVGAQHLPAGKRLLPLRLRQRGRRACSHLLPMMIMLRCTLSRLTPSRGGAAGPQRPLRHAPPPSAEGKDATQLPGTCLPAGRMFTRRASTP